MPKKIGREDPKRIKGERDEGTTIGRLDEPAWLRWTLADSHEEYNKKKKKGGRKTPSGQVTKEKKPLANPEIARNICGERGNSKSAGCSDQNPGG